MKRQNPTIALLLWLTASAGAGFIGFLAIARTEGMLYASLRVPSWAPPVWLFSPVWTVLYVLMGVAAWRVWKVEGERRGLGLWWLQWALNAVWPWLFFGFGKFGWALGEIVALWLAILATTVAFAKTDRKAAGLMLPYLAWVGFATALNFAIWRLNP